MNENTPALRSKPQARETSGWEDGCLGPDGTNLIPRKSGGDQSKVVL